MVQPACLYAHRLHLFHILAQLEPKPSSVRRGSVVGRVQFGLEQSFRGGGGGGGDGDGEATAAIP